MKYALLTCFATALFLLLPRSYAGAENAGKINEDALFNQEETLVAPETITNDAISSDVDKNSVSFSGFLNSRLQYYMNRNWIQGKNTYYHENLLNPFFQSNFSLDIRLKQSIKGFVSFSANVFPAGTGKSYHAYFSHPESPIGEISYKEKEYATYVLNEIFIDFNIKKSVFFRIGKQTLKWGQSYLWAPTDFINIDKKSFSDPFKVREGFYGLKIHVPFGTIVNLYSVLNLNDAQNWDEAGVAAKLEVLVKRVEMALSVAYKNKYVPVYGFNINTSVSGVDMWGELSLSYGDNKEKIRTIGLPVPPYEYYEKYKVRDEWIPKACIGLGKGFEVLNVRNRIRLDAEFFYNHSGYGKETKTIFKNELKRAFFLANNLYEMNYYGKFYYAFFFTCNQLIVQDLSLTLNYIGNFSDYSSIVSTMLSYTMVYNLSLGLMLSGYIGQAGREYTYSGNALSAEMFVRLAF